MMIDTAALVAEGFRPYRKTTLTLARQMTTAFRVKLDSGDTIYGKRGDYACVSPDDGGRWIVDRQIFETTYRREAAMQAAIPVHSRLYRQGFRPYRKHQIIWAKKIDRVCFVNTIEGRVRAYPGHYLCVGPGGDQWPQLAARFEAHYEQVAANQTG